MAFTPEEEAKLRELIAMMPDLRIRYLSGATGAICSVSIARPVCDNEGLALTTVADATAGIYESVRANDGD